MRVPVLWLCLCLAVVARIAGAQAAGAGAQGDALLAAGNSADAGAAYLKAFAETRDPTFLKKAAEAHVRLGSAGRAAALEAAQMYVVQARTIEEARDAQAVKALVEALPEPAPPPPPPPAVVATPAPPPPSRVATTRPAVRPRGVQDPEMVAQWDVLHLSDGEVVRGVIYEVERDRYFVALVGGRAVVVRFGDVRQLTSEPNPRLSVSTAGDEEATGATAESGFRLGVAPGLALPIGDFAGLHDVTTGEDFYSASFDLVGRVGGEVVSGQFGFSPALRAEYVKWSNTAGESHNFLHLGGDLRIAGHAGNVVPYLFVSAGADLNFFEVADAPGADFEPGRGFGFEVGVGLDVLLARHFALGVGFTYHPGFTSLVTLNGVGSNEQIRYIALNAGISIY